MKKYLFIISVIFLSCIAHKADAAIAFSQSTSTNCGAVNNCGKAFKNNVSTGSMILVGFRVGSTARIATTTDSQGNKYTQVASVTAGADHMAFIFMATTTTSGALNVTSTISGVAATIRMSIHEYTGLNTGGYSQVFDASSSADKCHVI